MHNTKKYQRGGVLKSLFRHLAQSLAAQHFEGWWLQWLMSRFRAAAAGLWLPGCTQGTERLSVLSRWALPLLRLSFPAEEHSSTATTRIAHLSLTALRYLIHRIRWPKLSQVGLKFFMPVIQTRTRVGIRFTSPPSADTWRGGALCG